ncbi:MAG TPA: hypothetical protein VF131_25635 [Blastocatellia bacterium]|nr:hypothetical protein [Blastocatellia bacterium]
MKRIAFMAIALALVFSAGIGRSSARPAAQGTDLLRVLPDGTGVVVVDVQKVTSSSLWAMISEKSPVKDVLQKINEISDLGVSINDFRTVAVVFGPTGPNNFTAAVSGTFNQDKLLARARADQRIKLTSEKYKNYEVYNVTRASQTEAKSRDLAFMFPDAGTIVAGTQAGVRASIDTLTGGKPGIAQNAKLTAGLNSDSTSAVRFAIEMTPAITSGLQSTEVPLPDFSSINMIFGGVDFTSGVGINATLRSNTAEQAKGLADRLNGILGMAKAYMGSSTDPKMVALNEALKTVTINGADVDVKITGNLPMELLSQVFR